MVMVEDPTLCLLLELIKNMVNSGTKFNIKVKTAGGIYFKFDTKPSVGDTKKANVELVSKPRHKMSLQRLQDQKRHEAYLCRKCEHSVNIIYNP